MGALVARRVNPHLEVLRVSAKSGEGLEAWYDFLRRGRPAGRLAAQEGVPR